jgi:Protein of unknown function (DUF1559)/BlaR1 peptidase M56/Type II secretion system (T2SS), protein G
MNPSASTILWMSVQIALFSVVGFLALVLLRRRGPNAAAACCATVLGLTLPLAVMVICPWPRWSIGVAAKPPVSDRGLNGRGSESIVDATSENRSDPTAAVSTAADASPSSLAIWWQAAADWFRAGGEQQTADVSTRATWQTYLPWLMAAGIGVCLVRLAAGVWGVNCLRRNSRRIDDEFLRAMISEIVGTLDDLQSPAHPFTRSPAHRLRSVGPAAKRLGLDVRETAALRSAATIGWRRPVLLLPSDWRTWTETERRVVLAHELAHVARRDYLAAVVARVATSIHFYQPLVLWLSRQLRIQQELAADSHAAAIAGGRQTYLTTLAQMALRADDQPLPWAARAFLPGTSMLIKRVAWLKQKGDQKEITMNRKTRWILAVAMAAVALAVAGVRGPSGVDSTVALAAADEPKQPTKESAAGAPAALERKQFRTFDYIPDNAKFIMAISPSELLKFPSMQQLQKIADNAEFDKKFGLPLNEIEDVKVIQTSAGNPFESSPRPPFQRLVIRSVKPHDWKKWISEKPGIKPKQIGDKTVYEIAGEGHAYIPDDRTLVVVFVPDEVEMKKIIFGAEKLHSEDPNSFPPLLYSPFAAWADTKSIKAELDKPGVPLDPIIVIIRSMFEHTKTASLWANLQQFASGPGQVGDQFILGFQLACESEDAAKQSLALLGAARALTQTFASTADKLARESMDKLPPEQRKLTAMKAMAVHTAMQILERVKFNADGTTAQASVDFVLPSDFLPKLLEPALIASREAAMRAQGMNNLKQIGLAIWNYENVNKHLPPAAIRDKNGKPLLSWRVAILPYLEQKALYDEFHLDEPWDSEHNKALIAKMPDVYREPHEDATSTNASYFMPTDNGTSKLPNAPWAATVGSVRHKDGVKASAISDGVSKTIMVVEKKSDVPWTKPQEIEIELDPDKPLPKFGGHLADGLFSSEFADGSIHMFSQSVVDANLLRDLFTINGGEMVDVNVLEEAAAAQNVAPVNRNRDPINSARAQILIFDHVCPLFETHVGRMPKSLNELVEPPKDPVEAQKWAGPYIDKLLPDPWGNPYHLQGDGTQKPRIWSSGPDGKDGTADDITLDAVQK